MFTQTGTLPREEGRESDSLMWQCGPSNPGWHLQRYSLKTSPRLVFVITSHNPSFLQGLGTQGPEGGQSNICDNVAKGGMVIYTAQYLTVSLFSLPCKDCWVDSDFMDHHLWGLLNSLDQILKQICSQSSSLSLYLSFLVALSLVPSLSLLHSLSVSLSDAKGPKHRHYNQLRPHPHFT